MQSALDRSGNPFDVGDNQLSMEIKREYLRMSAEDTYKLSAPAVERLNALGFEATAAEGIPNVFATLSKAIILEIESEPWVGGIYLADQSEKLELDTAIPSDRVSFVWDNGFDGSGVGIAILEGGKIDFTDDVEGYNYLNQGTVRSCSGGIVLHKT